MAITNEKLDFMLDFANRNNVTLTLDGECGFGRECVGILATGLNSTYYPDYEWYDDDYNPLSGNEVYTPEDAYHKHPCVAVLGRGDKAEEQLYEWLKWFDDNNYRVQRIELENPPNHWENSSKIFWRHEVFRMIKNNA